MKIRIDKNANYKAIFFNGKTIRQKISLNSPISAPKFPEIEDVAINDKCFANCSYCYTSATNKGKNFDSIVDKANEVWGSLDKGLRPFQIAIGGAGESTIHPNWIDFVKTVKSLGITPNYTTNGMHLSDEILKATEDYCGGVALSFHPHIPKIFERAADKLIKINTKLNFHIIIGEDESLDNLKNIFEKYKDNVEYFVLLPYQNIGRAKKVDCDKNWKNLFEWLATMPEMRIKQFAFGALFYEYLNKNEGNIGIDINIYEPEIYSGYRIFDQSYNKIRKSSYNLEFK